MTENHSIASGSDRVSRLIDTAETSGITRLSRTDSESEGEHLRRVAEELSGSGENRLRVLESLLSDRNFSTRLDAALELGKIGSFKSICSFTDSGILFIIPNIPIAKPFLFTI